MRHTGAGAVIACGGLGKSFDGVAVVRGVDLQIAAGSIVGFIGPSGCGKTTTVRLLTGLYEPTEGWATINGTPAARLTDRERQRIGYLPQIPALFPELSLWENLSFHASMYGLRFRRRRRLRQLLEWVELAEHRDKRVREVSGGMQRRLALAASFVHDPPILFLDEPTAGIDPILRAKFWERFRELREDGGRTIFVTTQYVGEASYCDVVGLLSDGELLMIDTPDNLRRAAFDGEVIDVEFARRRRSGGPGTGRGTRDRHRRARRIGAAPMADRGQRRRPRAGRDQRHAGSRRATDRRGEGAHRRLRRGVRPGDRTLSSTAFGGVRISDARTGTDEVAGPAGQRAVGGGHPMLGLRAQGARRDRAPAAADPAPHPRPVRAPDALRRRVSQREPRAEDDVRRPAGLVLRGRHRRVPRRARALRRPSRVHRRRGRRPRRAGGRRPRRRRRVPGGPVGPGAGGRERRDRGPAQQDRPDPDDRRRHRFPAGGPGSQRLGVDRGRRRVTVRAPPRRRTGDGPV